MKNSNSRRRWLCCFLVVSGIVSQAAAQHRSNSDVSLRILRAEDERRWDPDLETLLTEKDSQLRIRAALAAGRIGDDRAVPALISLLQKDHDPNVRAMAAFALGEIESPAATAALQQAASKDQNEPTAVRARAVEALGKIAAALPKSEEARSLPIKATIHNVLAFEAGRRPAPDIEVIVLGLTAVLRARPEKSGPVIARFLTYSDAHIRANAANTLGRLKLNDGNAVLRRLVLTDADPLVRANAARVLGVTEDKEAYKNLLDRSLKDPDLRVRVSAIRALATFKDLPVATTLVERGNLLVRQFKSQRTTNELLEIAATLGRLLQGTQNKTALSLLKEMRNLVGPAPEIEIALARISPTGYLADLGTGKEATRNVQTTILVNWKAAATLAQGLGVIAALPESTLNRLQTAQQAENLLLALLDYRNSGLTINTLVAVHSEYAVPEILRALAAFKPKSLAEVLRRHLSESDIVIRATAAELLGELPPNDETAPALIRALPEALNDKEMNDVALSILDALGKQKSANADKAVKSALESNDQLVRRKAVALLKENGVGDFSERIGIVQTKNTTADYERALARRDKQVRATVNTTSGNFVIEFLPEAAPLTVDNFVTLARKHYFDGQIIPRVVPNFVIQAGDPRGDQNGGPGYSIRCEINEMNYERGVVGMALSGKDTGGSQWFVTHSPQPHLDGGYTVFGRVVSGMDVVDRIVRGDAIRSISISERARPAAKRGTAVKKSPQE